MNELKLNDQAVNTVKDFIEQKEGYIVSSGTLKTDDLLGACYDFICEMLPNNDSATILLDIIGSYFTDPPNKYNLFYGNTELIDEDEAFEFLNCDIYNFFYSLAPEGYFFGSSEGDGALIGFLKIEGGFDYE